MVSKEELLEKLEERLILGEISEETYKELKKKHNGQDKKLDNENPNENTAESKDETHSANISVQDNVIQRSELNISDINKNNVQDSSTDQKSSSTTLHDNVITRSTVTVQNIHNVHVDKENESEMKLYEKISEILQTDGEDGIFKRCDEIDQLMINLKLPSVKGEKIIQEMIIAHKQYESGAAQHELGKKKYILLNADSDSKQELLNAHGIVKYINEKRFFAKSPLVKINGEIEAVSIWEIKEVFNHPELEYYCNRTERKLDKSEVTLCQKCKRIFDPDYTRNNNMCVECYESEDSNKINIKQNELISTQDIEKIITSTDWSTIPPGEFKMGSPENEESRSDSEILHNVRITKNLYIYNTPVTKSLYNKIIEDGASDEDLPVVKVNWFDAIKFCNRFSKFLGLNECYTLDEDDTHTNVIWDREAVGIRLLTEAEWEFSARAGQSGTTYMTDETSIEEIAVYDVDDICNVKSRKPNNFGLYDMLGCVWEWVWDSEHEYHPDHVIDPYTEFNSEKKVLRGGSYFEDRDSIRFAKRRFEYINMKSDDIGFRFCISN